MTTDCKEGVGYKMTSDNSIALQLITKMDELLPEDSVVDVCTSVFEDTCIYDIKMSDLLLLLQKIDCDSEAIVHKLGDVIKGWDILGRHSNLHREHENFRKTIWFNKEVKATTDSEFSSLWDKICCLLYAIEYGEIETMNCEANNFSPLGTLLKLSHIVPGTRMSRLPPSDLCVQIGWSVLRMIEVISIISPLDLFRPDVNGRHPLHNAATAFYSYNEHMCNRTIFGNHYKFIDDFDGINMDSNYKLWEGEQIFSYLLARYDSQRALEKDKNGDTVLSILLKDTHRRPIIRIWLALEAFPRLCQLSGSSGNIPFYDALDTPKDMDDEASIMDQLYLNNCFINAYDNLGLTLNSSPEDILRRFYVSIEWGCSLSGKKYLDENDYTVQSTALTQAARLLSITGITNEPKLLIDILEHISSMGDRFDDHHYQYESHDQIESGAKLLIEVTVGESNPIDVSFFIERAFNGNDCIYNREMRTIFYQWVLKALLKCRLGDCIASIELFLNHAIPYYKAMATYCTDAIVEIQEDQEEQGPAAEKQIAQEKEELQEIAIESNLLMTSLLASSPKQELCCCDCARKPLLHIALELASGYDGIALSILGIEPSRAKVRHNEELPLHVALRNGCEGFVIEKLLSLFPESVTTKDDDGLYPFMLAASSCVDLDYVYLLLRKYPSGIMQ